MIKNALSKPITRQKFAKTVGAAALGLRAALEFEKMLGAKVPTIPDGVTITGAQAVDIMRTTAFNLFPGLRS
ncbi:MAG: hypothetical protein WAJ94_10660 [Candidatus Cybelea sp.]